MATVISYPNNTINDTITVSTSLDSAELVKYINVDVSLAVDEDYIEVVYNGETITLLITDECRYTPKDIHYINKDGAQQVFTFFKASTEDINVSSDEFETDKQPVNYFHQFEKYNVQAKKSLSVNTGFISEDNNEDIKQMLLSSKVWLYDESLNYIPLNVSSKQLEYKTRQKDRLINYTIKFEYAFNEINTI